MRKHILTAVLCALCALGSGAWLSAQTLQKHLDFPSGFTSVSVSGEFQVTYRHAEYYSVDWTIDQNLQDYVEVSLRSTTLTFSYNSKAVPKDVKKIYQGRNAPKPVFRAVVYGPTFANLSLSDAATFDATGTQLTADVFNLTQTGTSKVNNLSVSAASINVEMGKNSQAVLDFGADAITIKTADKAVVTLKQDSDQMSLNLSGSSSVSVQGNTKTVEATLANGSRLGLNGNADKMTVNAVNACEMDGINFAVREAEVVASSGAEVYVKAAETISLDLKKGEVYFLDEPLIKVVNITNSTVQRFSGEKNKKR